MKVQGPGRTKGPSKTNKSGSSSKGDAAGGASFSDLVGSGVSESSGSAATQSIAHVDALLAVQAAEDPAQQKSRQQMRARAGVILDALDDLRNSMLAGDLNVGQVVDLAGVVSSHREKISDPVLTSLLDEIDLRAQVELAKLRVALDKGQKRAANQ